MSKTSAPKFRVLNSLDFNPLTDIKAEKNDQPSETQPDMTLSLKEMVYRHHNGQHVPQFRVEYAENEEELINFKTLDIVEQQIYREQIQEEIAVLQERYQTASRVQADPKIVITPNPQNDEKTTGNSLPSDSN